MRVNTFFFTLLSFVTPAAFAHVSHSPMPVHLAEHLVLWALLALPVLWLCKRLFDRIKRG